MIFLSFNLGDGPVSAMAQYPIELGQWHNVEIRRTGRQGTLRLEGEVVGEVSQHISEMIWSSKQVVIKLMS